MGRRFLEKNLPTLEQLNPNTNFLVREFPDEKPLEKPFIRINYGDCECIACLSSGCMGRVRLNLWIL
jgi:hypothetical protein